MTAETDMLNAEIACLRAEVERREAHVQELYTKLYSRDRVIEAAFRALDAFDRVRFYVAEGEDLNFVKAVRDEARRLRAELEERK